MKRIDYGSQAVAQAQEMYGHSEMKFTAAQESVFAVAVNHAVGQALHQLRLDLAFDVANAEDLESAAMAILKGGE